MWKPMLDRLNEDQGKMDPLLIVFVVMCFALVHKILASAVLLTIGVLLGLYLSAQALMILSAIAMVVVGTLCIRFLVSRNRWSGKTRGFESLLLEGTTLMFAMIMGAAWGIFLLRDHMSFAISFH